MMLKRSDDPVGAPGDTGGDWSVPRSALLDLLLGASHATLVVVSGPAGAGKTSVAEQWAAADPRTHELVRLAEHLDEPTALAAAVIAALESVGPAEPIARAAVTSLEPSFSSVVLPGIAALATSRAKPYLLVLDDVHLIRDPDCVRLLRTLADAVPEGSALAMLSRESAPLWVSRYRADGRLLELSTDDLAFDDAELEQLLVRMDLTLAPPEREALLARTEGWAVALYLEALALGQRDGGTGGGTGRLGGAELAFVGDYIEAEILEPMPVDVRTFLRSTAILDDIDAAACDALLGRTDSAAVLDALRRSTPLVAAVDAERRSYRYHHLLRGALLATLERTGDAADIAGLHRRAAGLYLRRGDIDAAIRHSAQGGDVDATAAILWQQVVASLTTARQDRLARWIDELTPAEVASNRWLSQASAWSALQSGEHDLMRRWILRSEAHAGRDWRADVAGDPYAASLATLVAIVGQLDLRETADLCSDALSGLRRDDPLRAPAAFICAVALTLLRDPGAMPMLLEAESLARALEVPLIQADALSWRGVLHVLGGDVAEGTRLIFAATALIEEHDLVRLATSAHCITAQALAFALHQDRARASVALATSRRLTLDAEGIAPWFHACGRLVQARTALLLGDVAMARLLLVEARAAMTADLAGSAVQDMLDEAEAALRSTAARATSVAPLTAAEMRVLQFLPSHLTFPQIGEHLFLSANTVKTHALAIYRKLGCTSRDEAVTQAQALGLVEAPIRP